MSGPLWVLSAAELCSLLSPQVAYSCGVGRQPGHEKTKWRAIAVKIVASGFESQLCHLLAMCLELDM
jgi:hypothetical protein